MLLAQDQVLFLYSIKKYLFGVLAPSLNQSKRTTKDVPKDLAFRRNAGVLWRVFTRRIFGTLAKSSEDSNIHGSWIFQVPC